MNVAITAVIPSYNRADLISETVSSAVYQTQPFAEIIVIDDTSTDTTLERLPGFGEKITVIVSTKVGVQLAPDKGAVACIHPFVTLCVSVDLLLPTYVETISNWSSSHPECDSNYSNFVTFDQHGVSSDKFSSAPKLFIGGSIKTRPFVSKLLGLYGKSVGFQPLFSSSATIKKIYQSLGIYNRAFNAIGSEVGSIPLKAKVDGDTALSFSNKVDKNFRFHSQTRTTFDDWDTVFAQR